MAFELDQIPNEHRESIQDINSGLERLRDLRKPRVTAMTSPIMPKVVWKIETYAQGLTYRTVALAEGVCNSWNDENGLAAVILGRSLVETAGMAWSFWDDLESATATGIATRRR